MAALLPPKPFHPLGTHRSLVPDRDAMDAILLVLRIGTQWDALSATGGLLLKLWPPPLSGMGARRVFAEIWRGGFLEHEKVVGTDWAWLAADGAMTRAPLGSPKTTGRAKNGAKHSVFSEGAGVPIGLARDGADRQDQRLLAPTLECIPIKRPRATAEQPQGLVAMRRAHPANYRSRCEPVPSQAETAD